jgi:hypothetical protein
MKATSKSLTLKVQRAEAHAVSLQGEIGRWAEIQSESIYRDLQNNGRDHIYRVRKPEPFNHLWLVIMGEILYNLRSALDHLAWALVEPYQTTKTEFPIFGKKNGSDGFLAQAPTKLPGLQQGKPGAWDIIEKLQPYHGGGTKWDPATDTGPDPLWTLHELNNIDKHRHPFVSTSAPQQATWGGMTGPGVGLPEYLPAPDRLDFVDNNRVATFRLTDPHPEVDLQAEFALNVFFDKVASPNTPATEILGGLAHYVQTRVIGPLGQFI